MKVIAESFLRERFRKEIPKTFKVEEGQILTPSATQYLAERGVMIVRDEAAHTPMCAQAPEHGPAGEGAPETKPGHMTRLRDRLVLKDHPRIRFRGGLDSLQASILLLQHKAYESGRKRLVEDLGGLLAGVRAMARAEMTDEALPAGLAMTPAEAGLWSQPRGSRTCPGEDQLKLSFDMGDILLGLNELRCSVRKVEVLAVSAFKSEFEVERQDIVQALNGMSRAVGRMMLKENAGKYR